MRIKDFTDTIRHLTDPFNIPEARRMIQENPALSREQFAEGQLVQPGPGRQGFGQGPGPRGDRKPLTEDQLKLLKEHRKYFSKQSPTKVKYQIRKGIINKGTIERLKKFDKILEHIKSRDTINQGEMIKLLEKFGYDKPAHTFNLLKYRGYFKGKDITRTLVNAPPGMGVSPEKMEELQKAAKYFYDQGRIASPDYLKNPYNDRVKISQRVGRTNIGEDKKVFKKTVFDPLPKKTQEKIKEVFPEADFSKSKWGVDYPDPKGQEIKRFVRLGFKQTTRDHLTNKQIADVKTKFSDVPESEWNFRTKDNPKGFKYGLSPTKKESQTTKIITFLSHKPHHAREFGFQFAKGDNYLLSVFERIRQKLGPKDNTYVPKYEKGKIVAFQDNTPKGGGKIYHHADYKGTGLKIMEHPEFARANTAVKLIEETRNVEMKGATFNKLLNSLLKSPGTTPYASALERHHGDLFKDPAGLQILTRDQNRYEQKIQKAVKRKVNPISIEEGDKLLKKKGIRTTIQGKEVGAPVIDPKKQIADYKKYIMRKTISQLGCGGRLASQGGGDVDCYAKGLEKLKAGNIKTPGERANFIKLAKTAGGLKGIARMTGLGLAWEAAFAPVMAAWMMPGGESPARILNELAYGLPIVGETEKEERKRHMGETGFNVSELRNLSGDREYLQMELNEEINRSGGREGKSYKQYQIEQQIKKLDEKVRPMVDYFYEGPAGQYFGEEKWGSGEEARVKGLESLEQSKADWIKKYQDLGLVAKPGWKKHFRTHRMGGGIMGLKK